MAEVRIDPSWKKVLGDIFDQDSFKKLKSFLASEVNDGQIFYPPARQIFAAFDVCPFENTKVVILGQDPYHGPGQAHGLSFSVDRACVIPPSLKNIYKELQSDCNCSLPHHGDLHAWATQGVLLLNTTLTVRRGQAGSHQGQGWEIFTDQVIQRLSEQKENLVFLLWGNFARSKRNLINTTKHCVLEAPHPSPFSAHSGFFGCGHFSKTNTYLEKTGQAPIDWQIT